MSTAQILIVEDDGIIAKTIQKNLEDLGYTVPAIASSGEEAVLHAKQYLPNLILMDIFLEGTMDGIEAAIQIKKHFDIPVIYVTAFADRQTLQRAKLTEPFGYILKPFNPKDLSVAVELALHKHEMEKKSSKNNVIEELNIQKAYFEQLFENSPDGIVILNNKDRIVNANKSFEQIFQYSVSEIKGKYINDIIVPDGQRNEASSLSRKVLRMKMIKEESTRKRKDGSLLDVFILGFPIEIQNKQVGVYGIYTDITGRKRLQDQLTRAQRLESAGRVAGQIAHDFNNLLSPLTAYPELIRQAFDKDDPTISLLDEMESSAKKIAEINQQLLALGRRGHYAMELIDVNSLLQSTITSLNLSQDISLKENLEKNLPLIRGGEAQLTRVLINLIHNAVEAMVEKGVLTISTKKITLDTQLNGYPKIKKGDYVKFDISDTGPGIAHAIKDKIFEPFFTTKRTDKNRGSGLGLSVVHNIVEDHKGYITLQSSKSKGTTFSLYFPVPKKQMKTVPKNSKKLKGGNEVILIVDDDPMQVKIVQKILKQFGYHIDFASSGQQAVEYVKTHPQDLLILDMAMDGIDGTETYRQILQFNPAQKAIILSGYAVSKRVQNALELGVAAFVSKPINPEILASTVRKVLDQKRQLSSKKEIYKSH